MQLIDIRNEVFAKGFDPTLFGVSRVTRFINEGYRLVCRRVNFFADEGAYAISTAGGTATYGWPSDFGRARSLFDTNWNRELARTDVRHIDESSQTQGRPRWYAMDGQNLHLYPIPDGVYSLELRYWALPALLVNDTDTPIIPEDWQRLLIYWASKECYAGEDDPNMANYWLNEFNTTLAMFEADARFPDTNAPARAAGMWGEDSAPLLSSSEWFYYP